MGYDNDDDLAYTIAWLFLRNRQANKTKTKNMQTENNKKTFLPTITTMKNKTNKTKINK